MRPRPRGFLSEEHIDHNGEVFDYISELHDYLWELIRYINPFANGDIKWWIDGALETVKYPEAAPPESAHKSKLIKSVLGNNNKYYAVYLVDGTKINIGRDDGLGAWIEVGPTPKAF